jgi:hypothetical protein
MMTKYRRFLVSCASVTGAAFLPILICSMTSTPAYGVNIANDCGSGDTTTLPSGVLALCAWQGGTIGPQSGSATSTANSFLLNISPANISNVQTTGNAMSSTVPLTTGTYFPPTPVTVTSTYVRLDGTVRIQDVGASFTLTLSGFLNNVLNATTGPVTINNGNCALNTDCILSVFAPGPGRAGITAIREELSFSSVGRSTYHADGSPVFVGVPEPGSWVMLTIGLFGILIAKLRLAKAS